MGELNLLSLGTARGSYTVGAASAGLRQTLTQTNLCIITFLRGERDGLHACQPFLFLLLLPPYPAPPLSSSLLHLCLIPFIHFSPFLVTCFYIRCFFGSVSRILLLPPFIWLSSFAYLPLHTLASSSIPLLLIFLTSSFLLSYFISSSSSSLPHFIPHWSSYSHFFPL